MKSSIRATPTRPAMMAALSESLPAVADTVSVIDPRTNTVTATIEVGLSPRLPGVLPDGSAVYVPNFDDDTVSVIDTSTNEVMATIEVGDRPRDPVPLPDGSAVYVANFGDNTVSVIGL